MENSLTQNKKNDGSIKYQAGIIAAFIVVVVLTIIGAALTSYLSSEYFNWYYDGQWASTNWQVVGALTLSSTCLSWVTFIFFGTIMVLYFTGYLDRDAKSLKASKALTSLCVLFAVLALATQIASAVCLVQLVKWPEATGDKIADTSIAATVMVGLAMIAVIVYDKLCTSSVLSTKFSSASENGGVITKKEAAKLAEVESENAELKKQIAEEKSKQSK